MTKKEKYHPEKCCDCETLEKCRDKAGNHCSKSKKYFNGWENCCIAMRGTDLDIYA